MKLSGGEEDITTTDGANNSNNIEIKSTNNIILNAKNIYLKDSSNGSWLTYKLIYDTNTNTFKYNDYNPPGEPGGSSEQLIFKSNRIYTNDNKLEIVPSGEVLFYTNYDNDPNNNDASLIIYNEDSLYYDMKHHNIISPNLSSNGSNTLKIMNTEFQHSSSSDNNLIIGGEENNGDIEGNTGDIVISCFKDSQNRFELMLNGFPINIESEGSTPLSGYILELFDAYGDGWNGGGINIINELDNTRAIITPNKEIVEIEHESQNYYTLISGSNSSTLIELSPDTTYRVDIIGGVYPSEITWQIQHNGITIASGAVYEGTIPNPYDTYRFSSTPYILELFDAYGDGWNGGGINIINELDNTRAIITPNKEIVEIEHESQNYYTLISGSNSSTLIELSPDTTYRVDIIGGVYPSEITWQIQHNGITIASGAVSEGTILFTTPPPP